jgi:hypothetical protein
MILEAVAQQRHAGWASLASVCKEWQSVIAKENFRQLKLGLSCLKEFERLIVRQRHLIRYIQLEIKLSKYSCRDCKSNASRSSITRDSFSLNRGIWKLLQILGTWESAQQRHTANIGLPNDITLELNAYSPSDTEHWFKNYHFTSNADRHIDDNYKTDDPGHGWINGQQVGPPPATAIPRLFSNIHLGGQQDVPQVGSITRLIVRRSLRRSLGGSLFFLLAKLRAVEHLVYEPWRPLERWSRMISDGCKRALCSPLPSSTRDSFDS